MPTKTGASSGSMEELASLKMLIMWMKRLVYSPHWLIRQRTPIHMKGRPKFGDAIRYVIKRKRNNNQSCVKERWRERGREREKDGEIQKDGEREKDGRDREKEGVGERRRKRECGRKSEWGRERGREGERGRGGQRGREGSTLNITDRKGFVNLT
jgi:hypothetical protein